MKKSLVPEAVSQHDVEAGDAGAGVLGVIVVDGRQITGSLTERETAYVVHTAEGEVVVPKARRPFVHRGSTTLPDAYFRQHGAADGVRGGGGGIVVTTTGEVFTGRVTRDERGVTISWPSQQLEMKIKLDNPQVVNMDPQMAGNIFSRRSLSNLPAYDLSQRPAHGSSHVRQATFQPR